MDLYLQFREEERAGKYKGYRYPNLIEVQKSPHLHLGYFANVTDELVLAAFRGEEELTRDEIREVAYRNNIPFSVLTCPKLIMLDTGRARHKKMVGAVKGLYDQLKQMAESGNQKAGYYLRYEDLEYQKFLKAVHDNRLSYIHYMGQKKSCLTASSLQSLDLKREVSRKQRTGGEDNVKTRGCEISSRIYRRYRTAIYGGLPQADR